VGVGGNVLDTSEQKDQLSPDYLEKHTVQKYSLKIRINKHGYRIAVETENKI